MPSAAKLLAGASGVPTDPNFRNVTLLLHGDGSNGAQNNTFIDGSTNNFTITRNGSTTQGSFSPYGSRWSNYFDGTGDYLGSSGGTGTAVGTGDFSVEAFVYWTSYPTQYTTIFSTRATNGASTTAFTVGVESSGFVYAYSNAYIAQTASSVFLLNTWNHVVFTRSGTTARLFVNGVLRATGTNSQDFSDQPFAIGANRDGTEQSAGYVSDVRLVKGSIPTAYQTSSTTVGTSVFTPPTAPLTAISGTSLLTCQSSRFLDASTNNFAITRNGDTRVSPFSPYAPTASYSAATNGGSAYFNGNADYLSLSGSTALTFGTGDFTIEGWFYYTSYSSGPIFFDARPLSTNGVYPAINVDPAGVLGYYVNNAYQIFGTTTISLNTWNHFALARSGTSTKLFLNGVQQGSTYTDTNNYLLGTNRPIIGGNGFSPGTASGLSGFLSSIRVVKGTALYTANFTVPTTPLTAISGTSLLLNFTNAAIIDSSADVDLETVGNAQISTSVKKFGTGSIYFDGTGDWLTIPGGDRFAFGTGDFTIECWINKPAAGNGPIIDARGSSVAAPYALYVDGSNFPYFYDGTSYTSSVAITNNQWNHVAVTRSSGTLRIFVNGTQGYSGTVTTNMTAGSTIFIGGQNFSSPATMTGYIDDLRITKGVARYTANFTPPTAAFPDQ